MKPPMDDEEDELDAAAVDSLFGGGSAPEESAEPMGPGEEGEESEEDMGEEPAEAPAADAPEESPDVLVADLKQTIDKLERVIGALG